MLLQDGSHLHDIPSALVAKAVALKLALLAVQAPDNTKVTCYSDFQVLIRLLKSGGHSNELFGILEDIRCISRSFLAISFTYLSRTENFLVDTLAEAQLSSCITSLDGV
ncbi:hypothetical protein V5N11_008458 [Cardamine amara subsp. amara]|uniref:RNase H type-1 domain-containing protein n=1 Tax=Cardamine amara subsp. amara TaxID=228776 RepID=A0ABD0ZW48_CARAN